MHVRAHSSSPPLLVNLQFVESVVFQVYGKGMLIIPMFRIFTQEFVLNLSIFLIIPVMFMVPVLPIPVLLPVLRILNAEQELVPVELIAQQLSVVETEGLRPGGARDIIVGITVMRLISVNKLKLVVASGDPYRIVNNTVLPRLPHRLHHLQPLLPRHHHLPQMLPALLL